MLPSGQLLKIKRTVLYTRLSFGYLSQLTFMLFPKLEDEI